MTFVRHIKNQCDYCLLLDKYKCFKHRQLVLIEMYFDLSRENCLYEAILIFVIVFVYNFCHGYEWIFTIINGHSSHFCLIKCYK